MLQDGLEELAAPEEGKERWKDLNIISNVKPTGVFLLEHMNLSKMVLKQ